MESRESVPLHAAQKEVEEAPVRNSGVESRKSKLGRHARVLVGAPGASPSPPRALAFALSLSPPRVRPRRQSPNGMQSSLAALVAFANTIRTFYRLSTIYSSRRPGGARPAEARARCGQPRLDVGGNGSTVSVIAETTLAPRPATQAACPTLCGPAHLIPGDTLVSRPFRPSTIARVRRAALIPSGSRRSRIRRRPHRGGDASRPVAPGHVCALDTKVGAAPVARALFTDAAGYSARRIDRYVFPFSIAVPPSTLAPLSRLALAVRSCSLRHTFLPVVRLRPRRLSGEQIADVLRVCTVRTRRIPGPPTTSHALRLRRSVYPRTWLDARSQSAAAADLAP